MTQFYAGKSKSFTFKDLPLGRDTLGLPHVKTARARGKYYHYFRGADGMVRLPHDSPEEFEAAYLKQLLLKAGRQSVAALVRDYERSSDFRALSESTRRAYSFYLSKLLLHCRNLAVEDFCVSDLERFAALAKSKGTASAYIKTVSAMFAWARRNGLAAHDPADGIWGKRRGKQWVYFVGAGDGEPIKIGRANNIKQRLSNIQNGNHRKMLVLASFLADDPLNVEREYHARFADHRLHGEWFAPHPDILAEIARLTAPTSALDHEEK